MTAPDGDHAAETFTWDIFIKCGDPRIAEVGARWNPAISADGWFSSPITAPSTSRVACGSRPIKATAGPRPEMPMGSMRWNRRGGPGAVKAVFQVSGRRRDVRTVLHAQRRDAVFLRAASRDRRRRSGHAGALVRAAGPGTVVLSLEDGHRF